MKNAYIPELTIGLSTAAQMCIRLAPPKQAAQIGIPRDDLPTPEERVAILLALTRILLDCVILATLAEQSLRSEIASDSGKEARGGK